ncbi:MAG: hypothetical protein JRF53_00645 [Deltaproteobacteria bacterium]|nr:hypothetical protein [Deltaproteobacteria bacterium]
MKERGYIRSETAIVLKLRRMKMHQNLAGHSARNERQGGDHWWILDQNIKEYVLKHLYEIDIRKVDKYWFVDMIQA